MKKFRVIIYSFILSLVACGGGNKVTYSEGGLIKITDRGYTTIVGIASDLLNNTGITDQKGEFYKIKGLSVWPKDVYGKKVKASGKLIVYDKREIMKTNKYVQGPTILNILTEAKWQIIE